MTTVRLRSWTISNWAEQQQYGIIFHLEELGNSWHLGRRPIKLPLLASEIVELVEIGLSLSATASGVSSARMRVASAPRRFRSPEVARRLCATEARSAAMVPSTKSPSALLAQWLNAVRPSASLSPLSLLTKHYSRHICPPYISNPANPKKYSPFL